MTNLIVSRRCNQRCAYCFAEDELSAAREKTSRQADFIPMEVFEQRLDYLDRSGITQARFLGGEPTLHPRFAELVHRARARNKTVVVFSNGLMPDASLEALLDLPDECGGVIMNVTNMGDADKTDSTLRRKYVLTQLGVKAQPGCTIYRTDQDLDFLIGLIIDCACKRAIRVGLAQPVMDGRNQYLPTRDYQKVGERLYQFAIRAAREGIKIELDCGFVRCMFSEKTLAGLEERNAGLGWHCNPIIDIDVDGKAFHCFPLAGKYWSNLQLVDTASSLREAFLQRTMPYRQAGIYKACSSCSYKINQVCSGGCLANTIKRFSTQRMVIKSI